MIPAHDSPLAALAFDSSGTKLATASEKVRLPWPVGDSSRGLAPCCSHSQGTKQVSVPTGCPRSTDHNSAPSKLLGDTLACAGPRT